MAHLDGERHDDEAQQEAFARRERRWLPVSGLLRMEGGHITQQSE